MRRFARRKKWLQDVASRDRWTKSDTATPRHQEQSRPKEVLKRQDQLGQAGKRKHFDGSEWKKKCSNFTKCGKPNEQLSRYNQTLLLAFILQTSEGLEVSFQRACRSQLRIGCYIAGMFSPHYFSKVKRAYQDRLDMKTLATIHQELLTGRVCR